MIERQIDSPMPMPPDLVVKKTLNGIVTLSNGERKKPAALDISSGRDGDAPRVHRRGAEGAMRLGRGEVALDVENVVDGGMG